MEEVRSTHRCEVVPFVMRRHENADSLSIVDIWGYTCIVRTEDWQGVEKAIYIPPDSLVDVRKPEFQFLACDASKEFLSRVRAKKLRGVVSFGLLIPAPPDAQIGDDWAARLGVEHYEPALNLPKGGNRIFMGGEVASAPNVVSPKYDVDPLRRYHNLMVEGEPIIISEKLDGCNSRYVYQDGQMHCGSRTEWKKEFPSFTHITVEKLMADGKVDEEKAKEIVANLQSKPARRNLWWEILDKYPSVRKFCEENPGMVVYGEVYGNINCIKYGFSDVNRFAAFDIYHNGRFFDFMDFMNVCAAYCIPTVPYIAAFGNESDHLPLIHKYNFEYVCNRAELPSAVEGCKPGTISEGVVVRPLKERWNERVGRVCFKVVSGQYYEKYK